MNVITIRFNYKNYQITKFHEVAVHGRPRQDRFKLNEKELCLNCRNYSASY